MKTEVSGWRVSTDIKTGLEREARRRKLSLSAVLDLAAEEWLKKSAPGNEDDKEQRRLQPAAIFTLVYTLDSEEKSGERIDCPISQPCRHAIVLCHEINLDDRVGVYRSRAGCPKLAQHLSLEIQSLLFRTVSIDSLRGLCEAITIDAGHRIYE